MAGGTLERLIRAGVARAASGISYYVDLGAQAKFVLFYS
jgi:hypothetical protein